MENHNDDMHDKQSTGGSTDLEQKVDKIEKEILEAKAFFKAFKYLAPISISVVIGILAIFGYRIEYKLPSEIDDFNKTFKGKKEDMTKHANNEIERLKSYNLRVAQYSFRLAYGDELQKCSKPCFTVGKRAKDNDVNKIPIDLINSKVLEQNDKPIACWLVPTVEVGSLKYFGRIYAEPAKISSTSVELTADLSKDGEKVKSGASIKVSMFILYYPGPQKTQT